MNGKKPLILTLLTVMALILPACTSKPDFELYEGNPLRIAVIGDLPKVKEEQVTFIEMSLNEMKEKNLEAYDAVFILEDHLFEAAESQYANVYLNSLTPFFFMGTDNFVPFTEEDLPYNKDWDWRPGLNYAVGILASPENDSRKYWGFSLYNDEKTDEHIQELYSRTFGVVEELNQ